MNHRKSCLFLLESDTLHTIYTSILSTCITHEGYHIMTNTKKDKLKEIKDMFWRKKVLKISDIFKIIGTKSRMTVYRYMKEMDYLTSYSHKSQYYTLREIAEFDAHGLWIYDDIGFSKHGTLFNTITYFVNDSDVGVTSSELKSEFRTVVKYALSDLVAKKKISREKPAQTYVYLNADSKKAKKQLEKRKEIPTVDREIAFRVLLTIYRFIEQVPSPEEVAKILKIEGSKISLGTVKQVFKKYGLEKKT